MVGWGVEDNLLSLALLEEASSGVRDVRRLFVRAPVDGKIMSTSTLEWRERRDG